MEDEDWVGKLQSLKFLKTRHERLEEITTQLKENHKQMATEEKLLEDFRAELALLEQEKQSHVEILRLINKDIEDMNGILKKSHECRQTLSKKQEQCFEEYVEVKDDVDKMRRSFDIESVPDVSEEGIHVPVNLMRRLEHPAAHFAQMVAPPTQPESYGAFHPCMPGYGSQHLPGQGSILSSMMGSNPLSMSDSVLKISQRAPPMKRCPNCGQDIHRNAPICPICKSKSHSKNPKKSKNKKQP